VTKTFSVSALLVALAAVAQAASVNQIRLIPSEIAAKESGGAGAGTSGVRTRTAITAQPLSCRESGISATAESRTRQPQSHCRLAASTRSPGEWRISH